MKSDFFLDNPKRVVRKLISAEGLIIQNIPACYAIENVETGNFYVGSTKALSKRISKHKYMLECNIHSNRNLQDEYNNCKDKNNFLVHASIEENKEAALDREQLILDEGHGADMLLNIASDARRPSMGYDRSESYEKTAKEARTPEKRAKVSREAKERWKDPVLRKKMIKSMGENVIVDGVNYGSVREASRETNISIKTVRLRLQNGSCILDDIKPIRRKVKCENKIYNSVTEAASTYGIKCNTMIYRLQSDSPTWKDFNYY